MIDVYDIGMFRWEAIMKNKKRKKSKRNKLLAYFMAMILAGGIFIPSLMNWSREARAAAKEPRLCYYADKDQLMNYDELMEGSGSEERWWRGYIAFGGGSTGRWKWYVAGKDQSNPKDNVILLLANDETDGSVKIGHYWDGNLSDDDRIHDNVSEKKAYSGDPSIQYEDGSIPTEVNLNHYGDSDLRKEFLRIQEDKGVFSDNERNLMLTTQVCTRDSLNDKMYTVNDILYAPTVADTDADGVNSAPNKGDICLLAGGGTDESKMTKIRSKVGGLT